MLSVRIACALRAVGMTCMRLADLAVRADRIHAHLVGAIGRAEEKAAGAIDRDVGIALRERSGADEVERARVLVDAVAVGLERLGAHGGDEEALVRAYRHRHHELCRLEALSRLQRTVRLQRVHPDIAVLGVGDVDERSRESGRARHERQQDRNNRHFHVSFLPGRLTPYSYASAAGQISLTGILTLQNARSWPPRPSCLRRSHNMADRLKSNAEFECCLMPLEIDEVERAGFVNGPACNLSAPGERDPRVLRELGMDCGPTKNA